MSDWVFLRGLVREGAHWDHFPEKFSRTLGAKVHRVDLPGCGNHWRQKSPLSLNKVMETVRAEALSAMAGEGQGGRKFYLFTISLGGMVAVEWANRHPGELAGAVLANTSLRGLNPLYQRLSPGIWPLLARIVMEPDTGKRERLILEMTSAMGKPSPALIENRIAIHQRHPVRVVNVFRQLWAAARYRPPAGKPPIPLLLLNSLGDRMVNPSCSQAIAGLWGAQLITHPWAGHDLPLDDPDWAIGAVKAWLTGLGG